MIKINDVTRLRRDHAIDLSNWVDDAEANFENAIDLREDAPGAAVPSGAIDLRQDRPSDNFFEVMPAYVADPAVYIPTGDELFDTQNDIDDPERARRQVILGIAAAVFVLAIISAVVAVRISSSDLGGSGFAATPSASASPVASPSTLPGVGGQTPWPTGTVNPTGTTTEATTDPAPTICVPNPVTQLCL